MGVFAMSSPNYIIGFHVSFLTSHHQAGIGNTMAVSIILLPIQMQVICHLNRFSVILNIQPKP